MLWDFNRDHILCWDSVPTINTQLEELRLSIHYVKNVELSLVVLYFDTASFHGSWAYSVMCDDLHLMIPFVIP